MFWKRRDNKAARVGDWKWVDMGSAGTGLFNLSTDIGESTDLSAARPEVLSELKQSFADWQQTMAETEPRGPFRDY